MGKYTGPVIGGVLLLMFGVNMWAQQKGAKNAARNTTKNTTKNTETTAGKTNKKVAYMPTVTLGNGDFSGGVLKVPMFDSLLKKGLHARDASGQQLRVISFNFNYFERNYYEDSAGDLHMMYDISKEFCQGDTISSNISGIIYDRAKWGDTVYFDQVLVTKDLPGQSKPDTFLGKTIKCALVK